LAGKKKRQQRYGLRATPCDAGQHAQTQTLRMTARPVPHYRPDIFSLTFSALTKLRVLRYKGLCMAERGRLGQRKKAWKNFEM